MDEKHNVPAAGEEVIFDEVKTTPEPQTEVPVAAPEPETPTPAPEAEIPPVEPQTEIPVVEQPQMNNQYQQTPPPMNNQQQYQQTPPPVNNQYQQVPPNATPIEPDTTPMTMGNWLVTMLLLCIPCVNIVLLFVWAFGDKTGNVNRKNFAKAQLVIMGVVLAIYLLLFIIMGVAIGVSLS